MTFTKFFLFCLSVTLLGLASQEHAQSEPSQTSTPTPQDAPSLPETPLLIHGIVLDKNIFQYHLQVALQNGQQDSLELRSTIREELYHRTLLLDEAKRLGYYKNPTLKLLAQEAQENFYINLLLDDYIKNISITDEMLRAEYDRQIQLLGPTGTLTEYRLGLITVGSEITAKEIILKNKKENFSKLAKEFSQDASRERGGDLGWINPNQLPPAFRVVIANMPKGTITQVPIQIGQTWHVIQVINRREGKPAPFEESKDRIKQAVIQNLKTEFIQSLRKAKEIQPS
jgi:peptidyl-prolyl cis-trans isomerase C